MSSISVLNEPQPPCARPSSRHQFANRRLAAALAVLLAWPVFAVPAAAAELASLYTAEVELDQSARNPQQDAYAVALAEVLLRVSGAELARDAELVEALFPDPAAYVVRFSPGAEGTLFVTFDGEALESVLKANGQTVWGADRPATLVWLAVDWGDGNREILGVDDQFRDPDDLRTADRYEALRERILALGQQRGLPILLPLRDAEELGLVTYADVRGGFDEVVLDASRRYGVDSILIGLIDAGAREPGRWRYYFGPERTVMSGEPEQVMPLVAERLASEFAVRGDAPLRSVAFAVTGIETVDAFGDLQQRLAAVQAIERLSILEVGGDTIRYLADVRGGSARLARALRFEGLLQSERVADELGTLSGPDLEFFYEPRARVDRP